MMIAIPRGHLLRLYDALAQRIPLHTHNQHAHLPGCTGTSAYTQQWLDEQDVDHTVWHAWLQDMAIDCDCALLLQVNSMAVEDGGTLGLNARRCSSCNALLLLYHVALTEHDDYTELLNWARSANVPTYTVLIQPDNETAYIEKVHPAGPAFPLAATQFYQQVCQPIMEHHSCTEGS